MASTLFWDFDGTLVYSEPTFFNAMRGACRLNGCYISDEDIRQVLRSGCTWHTPEHSYTDTVGQRWWERLFFRFERFYEGHGIPPAQAKRMNDYFKAQALDPRTYRLYEDCVSTLRECARMGCRSYILSNNFPELEQVTEALGLSGLLEGCIVSANVGYEKPRREIFEYARRVAGYPEQCAMIGDNPVADIQGGRNAGMRTVLVHREEDAQADYHCRSLKEVAAILEQ